MVRSYFLVRGNMLTGFLAFWCNEHFNYLRIGGNSFKSSWQVEAPVSQHHDNCTWKKQIHGNIFNHKMFHVNKTLNIYPHIYSVRIQRFMIWCRLILLSRVNLIYLQKRNFNCYKIKSKSVRHNNELLYRDYNVSKYAMRSWKNKIGKEQIATATARPMITHNAKRAG